MLDSYLCILLEYPSSFDEIHTNSELTQAQEELRAASCGIDMDGASPMRNHSHSNNSLRSSINSLYAQCLESAKTFLIDTKESQKDQFDSQCRVLVQKVARVLPMFSKAFRLILLELSLSRSIVVVDINDTLSATPPSIVKEPSD